MTEAIAFSDASQDRTSIVAEPTESLADQAYKIIEELIVTLKLAPGSLLSEISLSKRLGVGRTPIREALQRLGPEGLVVIMPRRGIMVSEINVKTQLQVLEVRRELVRLVARLAASRATQQERKELQSIAEQMKRTKRTGDDISFMRLDWRFQQLAAAAAHNPLLVRAVNMTFGLSRRFWFQHYQEVGDVPRCIRLTIDFVRAVASGDPAAATEACDRFLIYVEEFTRAALDAQGRT